MSLKLSIKEIIQHYLSLKCTCRCPSMSEVSIYQNKHNGFTEHSVATPYKLNTNSCRNIVQTWEFSYHNVCCIRFHECCTGYHHPPLQILAFSRSLTIFGKNRALYDGLISTMGFPILVRWHLYIESAPGRRNLSEEHYRPLSSTCCNGEALTFTFDVIMVPLTTRGTNIRNISSLTTVANRSVYLADCFCTDNS